MSTTFRPFVARVSIAEFDALRECLTRGTYSTREASAALHLTALCRGSRNAEVKVRRYDLGRWIKSGKPESHLTKLAGSFRYRRDRDQLLVAGNEDAVKLPFPYVQIPLPVPIGRKKVLIEFLEVWRTLRSPSWTARLENQPSDAVQGHVMSLIRQTPRTPKTQAWIDYLRRAAMP